jgi:hypothetical protein
MIMGDRNSVRLPDSLVWMQCPGVSGELEEGNSDKMGG